MNNQHINKRAFTIAEILLTLVIIGVVAALAIPGLVNGSSSRQDYARFMKVYGDVSTAVEKVVFERGGDLTRAHTGTTDVGINDIIRHLKAIKVCTNGTQSPGNCWHSAKSQWKTLDGSNDGYYDGQHKACILKNGAFVSFFNWASNCTWDGYRVNGQDRGCGMIYVDTNGFEKPNRWGRDIFTFVLTDRDGLYPHGGVLSIKNDLNRWCNIASNDVENGIACSAKILREGKINY